MPNVPVLRQPAVLIISYNDTPAFIAPEAAFKPLGLYALASRPALALAIVVLMQCLIVAALALLVTFHVADKQLSHLV